MRPEGNPLDLNNLPEDFARDGKLISEDSSSSAVSRKKKSGAKEGKDEAAKVYECRFCSLKFCKSQALGGHMNRHRQERETETLNKARQLVFTNDLAPTGQMGYVSTGQPTYLQGGNNMGDPALPFRPSLYPTRMFPTPPPPPPPQQPYMYTTSPPPRMVSFHSQYPAPPPASDYFVGHVLTSSNPAGYGGEGINAANNNNYTCIGAPVGGGGVRDNVQSSSSSLQNLQEEGVSWGRR